MKFVAALLALTFTFFTGETMTPDRSVNSQANLVTTPNTNTAISYELIQSPYPKEVQASLQEIRFSGGTQVVTADKTYVIICLGKRNTGGYKVVIDTIQKQANGSIVIKAHEEKPQPGKMTTQVITYPSTVVALPSSISNVIVDLK